MGIYAYWYLTAIVHNYQHFHYTIPEIRNQELGGFSPLKTSKSLSLVYLHLILSSPFQQGCREHPKLCKQKGRWAVEVAQSVECLAHERGVLCSVSSIHVKKPRMVADSCNTCSVKENASRFSSYPLCLVNHRASGSSERSRVQIQVDNSWRTVSEVVVSLHMYMDRCTRTHVHHHICTYVHRHVQEGNNILV